jgi:hypothetical protein
MSWQKWVLVGMYIFSMIVTWYSVDRERKPITAGVAFTTSIVSLAMIALVVTA